MMTTAASLLPLAPKAPPSPIDQTLMTSPSTTKPATMAPTLRPPTSLLLYPDVLVRASLSESLKQKMAVPPPPVTPLNQPLLTPTAMALVNLQHSQDLQQQALQAQIMQLQKIHQAQQAAAAAKPQDIIGMGISVPNPPPRPAAALPAPIKARPQLALPAPSTAAQTTKTQKSASLKKMMLIGNPLRAPPPLAKEIQKKKRKTVTLVKTQGIPPSTEERPVQKRRLEGPSSPLLAPRRVSPPPGVSKLSPEQLEFVEAAQRLHGVPSPVSTPKVLVPPPRAIPMLTSKALRPPPALRS